MLTSAGQPGDARPCREMGFAAYLCKPVSQSELLEAVASALQNSAKNQASKTPSEPFMRIQGRSLHVLLAEDNVVNQTLASHLLEKRGFEVTIVGDGNAALAAIASERIDIVLMDIQMPGKDGLEATAEIRAREATTGNHLPIIALTAHAMKGDRERCLAAGMDAYISKPIRGKELFDTIEGLLVGRSAAALAATKTSAPVKAVFNEALLLERTEGSTELCDLLVKTFLNECPTHLGALHRALEQQDARALAAAAHALKGAIAVFTDGAALDATKALEAFAKSGDLRDAGGALRKATSELDQLQAALTKFVHRQQGLQAKGQAAR
jgi:two-component system, sensor histidine kinase and response regulator